jgi:hypothetical protein
LATAAQAGESRPGDPSASLRTFIGPWYGIVHLAELAILSGLRLKTLPPELGSRQAVLARDGLAE